MSKPIKPSKNLVYCYACKRKKMLFEDGERLDRRNSQLLHELISVTDAMDRFKSLGLDLANRIQDAKDKMYIGCFQEICDLHEELLPYKDLIQKLPLESKTRFATLFRKVDFLYDIASKMESLLAVSEHEFDDYLKHEYPAISEENIQSIRIMVSLSKMEQSLLEINSQPEALSREVYKMKAEEITHYLTSIKLIVGRKVTAAYRRKLGLCN